MEKRQPMGIELVKRGIVTADSDREPCLSGFGYRGHGLCGGGNGQRGTKPSCCRAL